MRVVLAWVKNVGISVVVILAAMLAYNALSYIKFDSQYGFLRLKQQAISTGWYLPFYYSHVLIGGIILLLGIFQLHPFSRTKFTGMHRGLGYVYVMGILFFAAPGGLVMSLFIGRGPWVLSSFLVQSVLWFYFTAMALNRIRQGDVIAHRNWMWRSYALTFAAITLRVYIFFVSWSYDLSQPQAYATLAWLSWVPNLLVAEWFVRKEKVISILSFRK
jgi:uncharacterized membrane protein